MSREDEANASTLQAIARRDVLARATLAAAAALVPSSAAHAQAGALPMANEPIAQNLTADEIRSLLELDTERDLRLRAGDVRQQADDRAGRSAGAVRRRAAARLGALFHGDAGRAGAAAPHPQRPALSLLPGRSARGVSAARRRQPPSASWSAPTCAPASACSS